jgi:CIC family chloride channel protein
MSQHHRHATARLLDLHAQVRDYFALQGQRRKLFPRALLVGLLAGGIAVAFRWALEGGDILRNRLIDWAHQAPTWGWLLPMFVGAFGAGLAVVLVHRVAPEAAGSGIPHVKAVLYWFRSMRWQAILLVKFIGGVAGIGSGLALGREGPTVQIGSAVGAAVAQGLRVSPRERQTLIAAGAGAGLAAAFNAPLAGLAFVLEELQRHFAPAVFGATFVAAVTADVLTRSLTSQLPVFHVASAPAPPLVALPVFLGLGLLAGILGVVFNRGLLKTLELFTLVRSWPASLSGVLVGAVIGLLGWFVPNALGGGQPLVEEVLNGHMPLAHIPWWFLLRFGLTMLSYGCGAPGGIFAPLLVLGGLLGSAVGQFAPLVLPDAGVRPETFVVVGMAAYFAAIVRAPLTGIVLIVEMTNSYDQMLPLLVACFAAYAVADFLMDRPIYEALLERDLAHETGLPRLEGPIILEFTVHKGARFAGKKVHEVALPEGCVLLTLHRGLSELAPTADTRLEAGDRLTVVITPQAAEAWYVLREGCDATRIRA